ncbi:MAG TPA: hypothetical protein VFU19_03045 [Iamia sp.]|nr:hypothetical protein [Iamia sp.]
MRDGHRGRVVRSRLRRLGTAAALVVVALATGRAAVDDATADPIPGAARSVATTGAGPDATVPPPLVDGPDRPVDRDLPTEEGGTHRTWFAVGTWWAVLPDPATGVQRIWGLSGPDGPWVDTGTLVDERPDVLLDTAWDGEDLVVVATGRRAYRGHALRVHRFGWSAEAGEWVPAADHPIELTTEGEPLARSAVTADGTAWVVRPRGPLLEIARTAGRAARWSGWAPVPTEAGEGGVGGFDVLADGDDLLVVWRRRAADTIVVERRRGDTWTSTEVAMPGVAGIGPVDAAMAPGDGPLALLVPTTAAQGAAGDQAPALLLAVVPATGAPTVAVVARATDALARPALLVAGATAHVVAIAPPTDDEVVTWYGRGRAAPTALVVKSAPLADPLFGPGTGRRVMSGVDGTALARPLLPAVVPVDGGVLAVATGRDATRWATWVEGVAPSAQALGPRGPDAVTVLVDDTFDSLPVGGPGPTAWAPEDADPPVGLVVEDPAYPTRALRVAGGSDPVAACRPIPDLPATVVTVEAALRASRATGSADARLLTVRGAGGSIASVRLSRLGLAGWSTSHGRVTGLAVPPGAPLVATVRLDVAARTADVEVRLTDGTVLAATTGLPWLTSGDGTIDELCVRAAPGEGTAVVVDAVRVTLR